VRGLSPYPAAWTTLNDKQLKIFEAAVLPSLPPGLEQVSAPFHTDHKKTLVAATGAGFLNLLSLQLEGKKRMTAEEFLRGYRF
ncbi:MAG: methionyl-tRNA formyltransferase, partial [Leadbetterella sp.]|nr:methionyl-tRNA formyltransferase [Leadbetterella sp.]